MSTQPDRQAATLTATQPTEQPDGAHRTVVAAGGPAGIGPTTSAVAARQLRKYARSPQLLVTSIVSGAIFIILFRYIFGGAIDLATVRYVDFLIPGMIMTSVLITGTGIAVGTAEDIAQGFVDRLRSLPAPRMGLLLGRAVGETVIIAWGTAVTAAMGFAVGFRLQGTATEALLAFALCVVCGFAFLWIFICIGLVTGTAQGAQGMSMLAYPLIFISSAYVPANTLPGWLQPIAEHQPVAVMCNAVRSLALGDPQLAALGHTTGYWVTLSLIWSAGITIVFAPLAANLYQRVSR